MLLAGIKRLAVVVAIALQKLRGLFAGLQQSRQKQRNKLRSTGKTKASRASPAPTGIR
jgi:hypothetical protein